MSREDRLKRRLLRELVQENLELVEGGPPRRLRPRRRFRWAGALLAVAITPMVLLGSARHRSADLDTAPLDRAAASRLAASPRTASPLTAPSLGGAQPSAIDPAVFPLAVRRIAIDAGHGGKSLGARSPSGALEKDLALDIALRLRDALVASSFEVVMIRTDDTEVTLAERARRANAAAADLFVSIHLNWISEGNTRGIETYYAGPTDDPELSRLTALENRDSGYSVADFRRLLDRVYAGAREQSSKRLADSIEQALYGSLSKVAPTLADRGVKSAPFIVLLSTDMPAVLTEVSCLSNREDDEMLARPLYREYIAEALARGIRRYALAAEGMPTQPAPSAQYPEGTASALAFAASEKSPEKGN